MPVYTCRHIQLCKQFTAMYTPTPFEVNEADETGCCCIFAKLYSLPLSRMFADLNIFSCGLEGYLAPLPFPFLLFWLMDFSYAQELLSGARLSLLNAVVPDSCRMGFVPLFWSYETLYSSRLRAPSHHTHFWGSCTKNCTNMEQVKADSCKSMVPWIWKNNCDVELFIFIPGKSGEWLV